jgi:ribosomal-protein-alanine N-acetyltransferase
LRLGRRGSTRIADRGDRLIRIGLLGVDDTSELLEAIGRSRALHEPWVILPSMAEDLRKHLSRPAEVSIAYGIREGGGRLAGVVNINSLMRGNFQTAFLGYYALSPYERRGYMRAGLAAVIDRAFNEHELHRLEANIQTENVASARLVQSLGLRLEGHSPRYLEIGGEWRDHDRYALTVEEWPGASGALFPAP